MATEISKPKDRLINALVLAFSHSDAKDVVGTDALRMVLAGRYRELTGSGKFDLSPVWQLLTEQPGFEPEAAKPPLCRFKTWETELGMEVTLPPELGELSSLEVAALADGCRVPQSERDKVLEQGRFAAVEVQRRREQRESEAASKGRRRSKRDSLPPARRPGFEIAAAIIGVAALGFVGYTVYGLMAGPDIQSLSTSKVGDIPAKKVERIGPDVGITLSRDAWLSEPADKRTQQLEKALSNLSSGGTRNIFVRDTRGKVRATVQYYGSPAKVKVQFY